MKSSKRKVLSKMQPPHKHVLGLMMQTAEDLKLPTTGHHFPPRIEGGQVPNPTHGGSFVNPGVKEKKLPNPERMARGHAPKPTVGSSYLSKKKRK